MTHPIPKKLVFNPINEAGGQPTLADDLEWNFKELELFAQDTVDWIQEVDDRSGAVAAVAAGHYEELFSASDEFRVDHNLGGYPQVTVYDRTNREIGVVVDYINNNSLNLLFIGTLTLATVAVDIGTIV